MELMCPSPHLTRTVKLHLSHRYSNVFYGVVATHFDVIVCLHSRPPF